MTDGWLERFGVAPRPAPPVNAAETVRAPTEFQSEEDAYRERMYALGALEREAETMASTAVGRNDALRDIAWKLVGFVNTGALSEEEYVDALTDAGRRASGLGDHPFTDYEIHSCLRQALRKGRAMGLTRYAPSAAADVTEESLGAPPPPTAARNGHATTNGSASARVITMVRGTDVQTAAPIWAWHYRDHGRIQLGTLALFAGRPGAGKSTAARWFTAQATRGRLEGCWAGQPQNVAYIASEESLRYTIAPGLIAAGADMGRVQFVRAEIDGEQVKLLSMVDEAMLRQTFLDKGIRIVVVDPMMSTVSATANINANNETRHQVEPWARIADDIDGLVLGVVHLRKNTSGGDVVAAINGSSAFGEVARSIFAFAKRPDMDTRVFSQHKNSVGVEDLSLAYEIASVDVTLDDGRSAGIGTFRITGESEVSVEDIFAEDRMQNAGGGALSECQRWLEDYLSVEGPVPSRTVKAEARKAGDWSGSTIDRAARKLRVLFTSEGFPRVTCWSLPVASSHVSAQSHHGGVSDP